MQKVFSSVLLSLHDNTYLLYQSITAVKYPKPLPILIYVISQLFRCRNNWDITYLPARVKGRFFYLYMIMDVYSRKAVGYQVYDCESGELAAALITDTCHQEEIQENQLVLHSDNGGPMKAFTMLAKLESLGVASSFSRPRISNDNPYSESLFRTMKWGVS
ncbi:Integrase core domain-containing protein [Desulfocicer vacuolatum DSM 3385]|uniref:Integrase core domain-containing protein n=1 Tax=Desulfocicer vacuolatum DSM 3385 TaxID=1121400 RepID=A0A1W2CWD0_9BACT|nr:Integrase core domain-containing protein [Desulfocicer vacuolatum DSM 3385]